jgi:hypothetical protein
MDAKHFIKSWKQGISSNPPRKRRRARGNPITDLVPGAGTILGTLDRTARAWHGVGKRVAKGVTSPLKRLKSKRNPVDLAALRYEEFTGFPPDRIIEVESRHHVHAKTYALGLLMGLIVMDPDGKRFRTIMGPGVSYAGDLAEVYPNFIGEAKGHWEFNERTPTKQITWLTGSTGTRLGKKMVVHTIIAGGQELVQTSRGFDSVASQFPASADMVLWLNEHHGPVDGTDGTSFEQTPLYLNHKGRILAVIRLVRQHPGTFGANLADMLKQGLTFAEAGGRRVFVIATTAPAGVAADPRPA